MQEKPRIEYVDCVKGLGILLVILGHILPDQSTLKTVIYSFHMPLFFVAYGLVMKSSPMIELIRKRFKGILVPYIFWGLAFTGFTIGKKLIYLFWSTNESIVLSGSNGMLWFLPALFLGGCIGNAVLSVTKNNRIAIALFSIGLMALSAVIGSFHDRFVVKGNPIGFPFAFDVVILASSFILVGYLLRGRFEKITAKINRIIEAVIAIVLTASAILGIFNPFRSDYPSMGKFEIGIVPLYWVIAIAACFGMILVSHICTGFMIKKIFVWLGKNSMIIFIMHRTVIYPIKEFLSGHDSALLYIPALILITIYASAWAWAINCFVPELAGKTQKNKGDVKHEQRVV